MDYHFETEKGITMNKGKGVFPAILLALVTMVIIVAIFVASVYSHNYDLMREADICYNSGDYTGALARYQSLKDAFRFEAEAITKADYCNYNLAMAAMEEQNWDAAREYLHELKAYSPDAVNQLLAQCDADEQKAKEAEEREKQAEKEEERFADKRFLADLERAIVGRMEDEENNVASEMSMINGEWNLLEKYQNAEFKDAKLQGYAMDYLAALQAQRDALRERRHSDRQIWQQEAHVLTCAALNRIYEDKDYEFMAENDAFLRAYPANLNGSRAYLAQLQEVNDDLFNQTSKVEYWTADGSYYLTHVFRNNTPYSVSLVFYLDIFTLDNARYLGQTSVSMPEIPAGGEYRVRLDSADLQNGIRFNVDWVVTDIR